MHANSIASLCIHRNATQIGVSQLKFGTFLALHSICMITTASYASNRDIILMNSGEELAANSLHQTAIECKSCELITLC